jgi:N-acyl-D-aspartate/D-glutamate deacylase
MPRLETVIRGGRVVDGSGNPWFYADVGIVGDRIAAIAPPGSLENTAHLVDATGHVVCPGLIDIQSHSIAPLMRDGRCLGKITQGVTLEVMGEGWTPAPFGGLIASPFSTSLEGTLDPIWWDRARGWGRFGDWLEFMELDGVSPNIASFLAGGTLREYACGMRMGEASPDELETMRRVTTEAMQDGAMGVAYALIYPPDEFVSTDEIVEVCKVVARSGGVYITHMRSEGDALLEGVNETLEIARRATIPAEIYHLKASGQRNWPKMPTVIERINQARASGLDVTADMYPYPASGTGLDAILPTWVSADGKFWDNLENPELRDQIVAEVLDGAGDMNTSRPENIMPIGFRRPEHQEYVGKRLAEIAHSRGQDWVRCAIELLRLEHQRISTVYFSMTEDNLRLQIVQPWIKISSDAGGHDPATMKEAVHPRGYGTFPRVLAKYVREEGLLTLEDAIRKMTSSVANRLSIRDRGRLEIGCYADLVVFDPATVQDNASFEQPHQLSSGVRDMWVNGSRVLQNGVHTGAKPGRFVRGPGYQD